MGRFQWLLGLAAVVVCAPTLPARESEGSCTNSMLLNGAWEFVRGEGNEGAGPTRSAPLYVARVELSRAGRVLDELTFRFGMREVRVRDRNYQLNGWNLWLRGSNLVFEWDWGDTITGHEFDYLVTEAREMSMNSFHTHTRPPPRHWADIGDEHGTMVLAEFPMLFNYQDYKFTRDEWEIWQRNCLLDAAGWMARLWNHPSVILWVLSNESRDDNAWEEGPFQSLVNALDPTRPTMRTGSTGTKENYDVRPCGDVAATDEGHLQPAIAGWFQEAGQRTTTVSEYMNDFGHPRPQWTGVDDRLVDDLAVAQIGAEHTEAMRRARVDAILPLHVRRTDTDPAGSARPGNRQGKRRVEGQLRRPAVGRLAQFALPGPGEPRPFRPGLPHQSGGNDGPVPDQRLLA